MQVKSISLDLKDGFPRESTLVFDFEVSKISVKLLSVSDGVECYFYTTNNGQITRKSEDFDDINLEDLDSITLGAISRGTDGSFVAEIAYQYKENWKRQASFSNGLSVDSMIDLVTRTEKDMLLFVSGVDGIEAIWYRTIATNSDVILKEYNGRKYVEHKCLRLLTEENMFPQIIDAEFTEYGVETIDFPAEISAEYFETIFGCGIKPIEGDWVIIPKTNKAFRISSALPDKGADGSVIMWKLVLSNFFEETYVENDDEMFEITESHEKMFHGETEEIIENVINEKQNITPQIYGDMNRVFISPSVSYTDIGSDNMMYNLGSGEDETKAVEYKRIEGSVKSVCMLVSTASNAILFKSTLGNMVVDGGIIKIFGMSSGYSIEEYSKRFLVVNFYDKFTSLQVLDENNVEVFYSEDMNPRLCSGVFELVHCDLEIGRIRIGKKIVSRNDAVKVATLQKEIKSGAYFVVDDAIEPNNNPRAKENQFRTNL